MTFQAKVLDIAAGPDAQEPQRLAEQLKLSRDGLQAAIDELRGPARPSGNGLNPDRAKMVLSPKLEG